MFGAMSPLTQPARMIPAPVLAGRMLARSGAMSRSAATITTGTGTTGYGWVSARE